MAGRIDARLSELGLVIPQAAAPQANYVGFVVTGNLVFTAGQIPIVSGQLPYVGKLGGEMSIEMGQKAAALCALNVLSQVKSACGGDLDRVVRCVKLVGFVNATPDFTDHPKVVNGASDLIVSVMGEAGKHARSAVGMGSLPFNVAVEVEAVFEIQR
jgi:enamine deaminase RidA (YjgF/YER057c/UK114 family)